MIQRKRFILQVGEPLGGKAHSNVRGECTQIEAHSQRGAGSMRSKAGTDDDEHPYHQLVEARDEQHKAQGAVPSPGGEEPGFIVWHGPSMLLLVLLGTFLNMEVRHTHGIHPRLTYVVAGVWP